jgi:tRNA A-37 threonylcarbamoyl transferase component Bud32
MSPERYARVKEIFQRALDLPERKRASFLHRECAADSALRHEVEALLIETSAKTEAAIAAGVLLPGKTAASTVGSLTRWAGARSHKRWIALAALIVIGTAAYFVYRLIQQTMVRQVEENLVASLNSSTVALNLAINHWLSGVEQLARDPQLIADIEELQRRAGPERPPHAKGLEPWRDAIQRRIEIARKIEGHAFYILVDRFGRGIVDEGSGLLGKQPSRFGFGLLGDVIAGTSRFIAATTRRLTANHPLEGELVNRHYVAAPVKNQAGYVIGALVLGYHARESLAPILEAGRAGRSGETYLINAEALHLSGSRFSIEHEAINDAARRMPAGTVLPKIWARDPGGSLLQGFQPKENPRTWPPTRAAAQAISRRYTPGAALSGVEMEPYRDYRGVRAVGAWQWLPKHDIGIIYEMDAGEAFAPLRIMQASAGGLLLLGLLFAAAWMWSLFALSRMRGRLEGIKTVGQYTLETQLASGGMGEVFLANHALLKRPTAIKIVRQDLVTPRLTEKFVREVTLASQLRSPCTVQIYDFGVAQGRLPYCAMEFVPGLNLDEAVREGGPMPPARVIHVLRQVFESLAEAHGAKLIHRDIKPHNVMLSELGGRSDVVKVLDFGLAKAIEGELGADSAPSLVAGTPAYLAPERIHSGGLVDPRSDLYACGMLGYFLLSGHEAFTAGPKLFNDILQKAPPLTDALAAAPEGLRHLILECLEKDLDRRPASARELVDRCELLSHAHPWSQAEARAWWKARA